MSKTAQAEVYAIRVWRMGRLADRLGRRSLQGRNTRRQDDNASSVQARFITSLRQSFRGEERGPVLEEGEGAIVFVVGDVEEEALTVGSDVVLDRVPPVAGIW